MYRCKCGCRFEEALGKYGCPSCEGEYTAVIGRPPKYPDGTERVTVRLPKSLLRAIRESGDNVSEVIINSLRKVFKC
jgi:hypothetical protein